MKKIVALAAIALCFWQAPSAAANGQMDYLTIENRMQDDFVAYTYSYPQITRGESRTTEQRLNGFLREYSQKTALDVRLLAKKDGKRAEGKTTFCVERNDPLFFSIVFTSQSDASGQNKKGFVFLPQNGVQIRLEDLFSSQDFMKTLLDVSAQWRQEQGILDEIGSKQDFYLTDDALILLFAAPDGKETLSFSIPLKDLSGILCESLLSSVD